MKHIAVIRIRGTVDEVPDVKKTLDLLRLRNKFVCVVVPHTPVMNGMLTRVKDFVTWGELTEETYELLKKQRGKKGSDGKLKPFFRMHPPRGGFERKGIKIDFNQGGVLGNRGAAINDLLKRMM